MRKARSEAQQEHGNHHQHMDDARDAVQIAAQDRPLRRRTSDDDDGGQAKIDADMPQVLIEHGLPELRLEFRVEREPGKARLQLPRMRQIRQILQGKTIANDHRAHPTHERVRTQ